MFRQRSSFIQVFVKDVFSQANYNKNKEEWNGILRTNFRRTGLLDHSAPEHHPWVKQTVRVADHSPAPKQPYLHSPCASTE